MKKPSSHIADLAEGQIIDDGYISVLQKRQARALDKILRGSYGESS